MCGAAMSLAFFIRAAAGNVSATNLALATVLAEQILFTIGYILLVDVGITLMRDLHLQVCSFVTSTQPVLMDARDRGKPPLRLLTCDIL